MLHTIVFGVFDLNFCSCYFLFLSVTFSFCLYVLPPLCLLLVSTSTSLFNLFFVLFAYSSSSPFSFIFTSYLNIHRLRLRLKHFFIQLTNYKKNISQINMDINHKRLWVQVQIKSNQIKFYLKTAINI